MSANYEPGGFTYGPDWMPGCIGIAHEVVEAIHEDGWAKTWSDCEGFRISKRVTVWLDGYTDRDYEQAYLLRVWTNTDDILFTPEEDYYRTGGMRTLTLTDHLAVYAHGDKVEATWRQEPRLFFDADMEWLHDGIVWWAGWLESVTEMLHGGPVPDSTREHNTRVREQERAVARRIGLVGALPYLNRL